jgi:hypothetical protein
VKLTNRISHLERRNGYHQSPPDVTLADAANILRRLSSGVMRHAALAKRHAGEADGSEHVAISAAENHLATMGDADVIKLFSCYARHVRSGRTDLPTELRGCPTPKDFVTHFEAVADRMRHGFVW